MSVLHLQIQRVVTTLTSTEIYNKHKETSMHNNYFRMQQLQEYIEQVNFLDTSSCILQSPTANQIIYFVDFRELTSVERCFDN